MSDLVKRLEETELYYDAGLPHYNHGYDLSSLGKEAADEIKRLRAALEHIIRETRGAGNKGPVAAELARRALAIDVDI